MRSPRHCRRWWQSNFRDLLANSYPTSQPYSVRVRSGSWSEEILVKWSSFFHRAFLHEITYKDAEQTTKLRRGMPWVSGTQLSSLMTFSIEAILCSFSVRYRSLRVDQITGSGVGQRRLLRWDKHTVPFRSIGQSRVTATSVLSKKRRVSRVIWHFVHVLCGVTWESVTAPITLSKIHLSSVTGHGRLCRTEPFCRTHPTCHGVTAVSNWSKWYSMH